MSIWIANAQQESSLITSITSTHLVVGEVAYLDLIYRDKNPYKAPPKTIDAGEHITIQQRGYSSQSVNGDRYFIYQYIIGAEKAGTYQIPSLTLEHKGETVHSQPATLTVVSQDVLEKLTYKSNDELFHCYSYLHTPKQTLYPGEAIQAEYKIYVPTRLNVRNLELPTPDTVENCTAWRFSSPNRLRDLSAAAIDGTRYSVATFTTVISALQPGKAQFGPINTVVTIAPNTTHSAFGFTRLRTKEMEVISEAQEFTVLPFPTNPPNTFNGAVGDFTVEATLPTDTEINVSDSITASIRISGSGNLPDIQAPELEDSATWKVVDVSRVKQGDERKALNGSAEFTYILQPKRGATEFPRFTFTHFNPDSKKFSSITTNTIPVTVKAMAQAATSAILPNVEIPSENMQDILAPLAKIDLTAPQKHFLTTLSPWWWHTVPATILLLILLVAGQRKFAAREKNPNKDLKIRGFKKLSESNESDFLPAATAYAQKWIPDEEFTHSLVEKRDNLCYQPSVSQTISASEKSSILSSLKKLTFLFTILLLSSSQFTEAQEDHFDSWQSGDIQKALDGYIIESKKHPESADLLYNIGSCYYKLGDPGKAALYFERALALFPNHPEARKNLDFTQKQQGAILPKPLTQAEEWISILPKSIYVQIMLATAWALLLGVLFLKFFNPKGGRYITLILCLILSPILAAVSVAAWFKYPEQPLTDINQLGTVIQYSPVLTEPIDFSGQELAKKTLLNATPSSPCAIIAERDQWSYIELANTTRGWIKSDAVEFVRQ